MYFMAKTVGFIVIGLFSALVSCRPHLRAEDLEPFLDNPEALKEFGQLIAAEIRFVQPVDVCAKYSTPCIFSFMLVRSGKPSDLVAAGLGVENATLIDLVPGAHLGRDVVAGGVQVGRSYKGLTAALVFSCDLQHADTTHP